VKKNALLMSLSLLISGGALAQQAVPTDLPVAITATGECHDEDSLEVANIEDGQARYACLQNKGVQRTCDLDGRTARLNAFRQWMANLDAYQKQCEQRHGTFAFQSNDFQEPKDETFCATPFINVSYGRFENPICNFISRCPAVPVVCTVSDAGGGFQIPAQAILMPGVPVAIPVH
jgi:hypothetical protein